MDIVFGKTTFRAGSTVYAYDHLSYCVRKAMVVTLTIHDIRRLGETETKTTVTYNLHALDDEMHGSMLPPELKPDPFRFPLIDDGMVFATLEEALADLKCRMEVMRSTWAVSH